MTDSPAPSNPHYTEACPNRDPHRAHEWGEDEFHPDLGAWCPGIAVTPTTAAKPAPSTQHPDGGVPLLQSWGQGKQELFVRLPAPVSSGNPTHIAFPVAQAARLIDVDAAWARQKIAEIVFAGQVNRNASTYDVADAIIAALQKGAPE